MPLGINSMAGTDVCHTKEDDAISHVHLTLNNVMGAYKHLVPDGVGNKT